MNGDWKGLSRVLAVRLDRVGDLLMTTPALAALREGLPGATITLLTSPEGAALAPHLDMVDAVWGHRVPWMPGSDEADACVLLERLRASRFDAAVIFTVCTQSALPAALLLQMARIPRRLAHCRENPYALLTDWLPETDDVRRGMRHEVERQLALVARAGVATADTRLRFAVLAEDRARVRAELTARDVGRYAVLHPGASAASRRWPAERFAQVAQRLLAEGVTPVVCGSGDEAALARAVLPARGGLSLAGQLSLGELAALIEGAAVLVGNNSAPAHLAAAVGTPVVSLYALTNPQHTPWGVPARVLSHDVPCRGCLKSVCPEGHHACLQGVPAGAAVEAALELMHGEMLA